MKSILVMLCLATTSVFGITEIPNKTSIQSLKIGTEILLEMPLTVRAAPEWTRSLLLETSKVTFQNGHTVELTNSDSMFCDLKIEGNFTSDEVLEPRTLVVLGAAEVTQNKELRTKTLTLKLQNSVVSELKCTYPSSVNDVITVGDVKRVFTGDQRLRFQTSSEEIE